MSAAQFEQLSLQAVVGAAVLYSLALLAQLAGRAMRSKVEAQVAIMADGSESPATVVTTEVPDTGRADTVANLGLTLLPMAAVVHLLALVTRGLAADPIRVPWSNMYEFTLSATFAAMATYLVVLKRYKLAWLAPILTGLVVVILMADSLVLYEPVTPLQDALRSPWLVIHVVAAVIATGAFMLGGIASALYLLKVRMPRRLQRVPGLESLDRLAYRMHAFGFPVWTFAALITGPIWAFEAWGSYWSWDPKEVWAFITWVVYAGYLHARATAGWRGERAAVLALIGLATLLFNFIGINFFFGAGSMHSYA
ncbi:c-type cytochrome biogenesis protein CcsB [Alteromonas gracilis]